MDLAARKSLAILLGEVILSKPSLTTADLRRWDFTDLLPLIDSGQEANAVRQVIERISQGRADLSVSHGGVNTVMDAFVSPYQGDTTALRKAVDQVINDPDVYANAMPFVQSSGTGKSRLMVELGKDFFVLMVNLRDDDPAGSFSFPQPDRLVRQFLREMENTKNLAERWRLRYAAFLCAVFDVFGEHLGTGVPSEYAKIFENPGSKASYLDEVIQSACRWEMQFIEAFSASGVQTSCSQITTHFLVDRARSCFQRLRNLNSSKHPPPLVLVLDEAHTMMNRVDSFVPVSLLDIFRSVMADLKAYGCGDFHFAGIFLSTDSRLNDVTPTVDPIASQRLWYKSYAGALTCVPFDIFVEQNKKWTVAEISTLKFISTFGRPLFGALIKNGLNPSNALSLAQEKLAHARRPIPLATLTEKQTAFALLSRRILIHFRPLQSAAANMGSDLIARHLQVAFVVPKQREFVISGSPSEPFLVEAAAHMMATPGFSSISCLLNFANEGLFDAGESGEIVGRSLTIDAYDTALRKRTPTTPIVYHAWVPVLDFLKALFTDKVYEDIIKMKPYRQRNGQTLGEAFKNAVIRLTHYVPLSQVGLLTAANVRKAFLRGMGLVGAASQKLIDILIPILFVDLDKEPSDWVVDQAKFSHLMANWKNKATDATPVRSDPYDEYEELNTGLPTILMWNQFASEESKCDFPQCLKNKRPGRAVYFIDLYGIGSGIYRASSITTKAQQQYQEFVGRDDFFRDVPFVFEEYRSAVEGTLPDWSAASFEQTAS